MDTFVPTGSGFNTLGIAPKLLEILAKHKFITPTPIQQQSIPAAISGKDLMGIAQTGTGKTLAFGIPMIQRLAQSERGHRGLVILPTRELAFQVNETLKKIGSSLGLKTAVLIGGEPIGRQLKLLRQNPHIIIGTPGRLNDHLDSKSLDVSKTSILVLDEADRMLDMGFAPQIKRILDKIPNERQTMLFSATMPDEIVGMAKSYMSLPLRIEVAPAGTTASTLTQEVFFVNKESKTGLLKNILGEYKGSVLVFTRTKYGARKVAKTIRDFGETSAELHSDRSLNQRLAALDDFKIGRVRILVATDIAARGIDVTGIQLVVNFDLPANAEDYVHRIGRTGRAGMEGHAISFATPDQKRDIKDIERLIRKTLPVSQKNIDRTEAAKTEPGRLFVKTPGRDTRPQRPFKPGGRPGRFGERKPFGDKFSDKRKPFDKNRPPRGQGQKPWQKKRREPEYRPPRGMSKGAGGNGFFMSRKSDSQDF